MIRSDTEFRTTKNHVNLFILRKFQSIWEKIFSLLFLIMPFLNAYSIDSTNNIPNTIEKDFSLCIGGVDNSMLASLLL